MNRSNALLIILATVIVVLGAAAAIDFGARSSPPAPSDIGGAFRLVDQYGKPADQSRLNGKWTAVFFGYTFCPDVCPTTLTNLGEVTHDLGPKAERFQVIFVTVDPARDTPAQLKRYLSSPSFPPHVIGLTGTDAQIAGIARAYHVYYQKAGAGGDYTMDHSAIIYLMDPRGRFVKPLTFDAPPAAVAGQIVSAMAGE
jgi:protein SCO1/2